MSHTYHPLWRSVRRRSEWRFGFKLLCLFLYVCIGVLPFVTILAASVNTYNQSRDDWFSVLGMPRGDWLSSMDDSSVQASNIRFSGSPYVRTMGPRGRTV